MQPIGKNSLGIICLLRVFVNYNMFDLEPF